MNFCETMLNQEAPRTIREVLLPRQGWYYPSPTDWRNEVLYFLLPDRFSDGGENRRPLLDWRNPSGARPADWNWEKWVESGADRWQGGTIQGIISKLDYLRRLGVTALWVGPLFKQRQELNTYHGYGVQDFLNIDPRLGNRLDLVELVRQAHAREIRVILDIIFNHTGSNWVYGANANCCPAPCRTDIACPLSQNGLWGVNEAEYTPQRHDFGYWRDANGHFTPQIESRDDGVWPLELQDVECYSRAGTGNLGEGDLSDPDAQHKRSDFCDLRDLRLSYGNLLSDLARCYQYWIALTDCDGFRIDTLKHVTFEDAKNLCGAIKEYALVLGKNDFFLVGEVAGGDYAEARYIDALERNLNAVLDIGEMRITLEGVAKGLVPAVEYFDGFAAGQHSLMGSHRQSGNLHVSILNDHDHVFGPKVRFSADASSAHQVVAGVALQLLTLGIPCIYYGTEQALGGPEPEERKWLTGWMERDCYLREALFGPEHPRKNGRAGVASGNPDDNMPGFGPFGTAGYHCFNEAHPAYTRIAAITALRGQYPALRHGRQYLREISVLNQPFGNYGPGEIIAWSRILADEEFLCVLNPHGTQKRGARIIVDANLASREGRMWILLNTADLWANGIQTVEVKRTPEGAAYVEINAVPPSELLVLGNRCG